MRFYATFLRVVFVVLSALIVAGCTSPNPEPGPPVPGSLRAPTNVTVTMLTDTNELRVSWDGAESGVGYEVVREAGGTSTPLTAPSITERQLFDSTYPVGYEITYKVRSVKGGIASDYAAAIMGAVATGELAVANARASVLTDKSVIRVRWSPITQGEVTPRYILRRYASKSSAASEAAFDNQAAFGTEADGSRYYDDSGASSDVPHYYRIDWVDDATATPGAPGKFVFGIRSSGSDDGAYEPNDTWWTLPAGMTVFPAGTKLTSFTFTDAGVVDQDTDWFVYRGAPVTVEVKVMLENGSPLIDNLEFDYFYNGAFTHGAVSPGEGATSYFFFTDSYGASPPSTVDLYCRIRPKDEAVNVIGSYAVSLSCY